MSKWTSKHAILRDLCEAQGQVPVEIDLTVSADDKPPPLNLTEETEEEFFRHYGDGDVISTPDFGLIKEMLEKVSEVNLHSDECVENAPDELKDSPRTFEATPCAENTEKPIEKKKKNKRKERNVAIESIFKMENQENALLKFECANELPKLLKPNDFIFDDVNNTESNILRLVSEVPKEKAINTKPSSSKQDVSPFNSPKVNLEAVPMFKKKSPSHKPVDAVENLVSKARCKARSQDHGIYRPSQMADEYYKEYLERVKLKETIHEDIWSRAERQMKEIESKKKLAASSSYAATESAKLNENEALDVVRLPHHRHELPGDCVVCQLMTERGYDCSCIE